ncbi:hypothetical protein CYD33_028055, partial [Escherichia coli]
MSFISSLINVLTGSDDDRHSNTSLAWGAGVQFNP